MPAKASTTAEWRRQRARRQTEQRALDWFNQRTPGQFKGRARMHERIRRAKVPMREAKRLVEWLSGQDVAPPGEAEPGFADVQELRVRLIRRGGVLDSPQAAMLARMDRLAAGSGLTRETFMKLAKAVMAMPLVLSKEVRMKERELSRYA